MDEDRAYYTLKDKYCSTYEFCNDCPWYGDQHCDMELNSREEATRRMNERLKDVKPIGESHFWINWLFKDQEV